MVKIKYEYEPTEMPPEFDRRPKTHKEYSKECSYEKNRRGNIIKKTHSYYQNNENMWNNSYHSSKKVFEQYHQTKQRKEATLNQKINHFDAQDKQNAHLFKKKFV